ncbi:dienelactone hydrolase family protein [Actinomadura sp. 9N407]|uniref:dienelactone hydrolase family protein n=1 Tax=Actinomadura sp. 9N407 TaxID=3375154 RepID=UPI00379534D1
MTSTVSVPDGDFALHVWTPESGSGPGILLIHEVYGVGEYIRSVAEDLTALGYVVAAPDLFWRIRPGWAASHDEEGLQRSLELASGFDPVKGLEDLEASLERLRAESSGTVGVLGFCLGGSLAYGLGARAEGVSAVVSFYGSAVHDQLDLLDRIDCPLQFHYGGSDPYIPREHVAEVERAVQGRSNVEIHVEEGAGHAFHNRKAPMFHNPEPAARAWRLTEAFLARHLPTK